MVDVNRAGVVEPLAAPARGARTGGHHARVEQHRDAERRRDFEQRIEAPIVRVELLPAGVELGAAQAKLSNRSLELSRSQLAFPRIDSREANERLGILLDRGR